jgi:hypothetical protein
MIAANKELSASTTLIDASPWIPFLRKKRRLTKAPRDSHTVFMRAGGLSLRKVNVDRPPFHRHSNPLVTRPSVCKPEAWNTSTENVISGTGTHVQMAYRVSFRRRDYGLGDAGASQDFLQ